LSAPKITWDRASGQGRKPESVFQSTKKKEISSGLSDVATYERKRIGRDEQHYKGPKPRRKEPRSLSIIKKGTPREGKKRKRKGEARKTTNEGGKGGRKRPGEKKKNPLYVSSLWGKYN